MSIGFIALLDDISILLDDAAVMTKVSMTKTAGLLGDDLAVNAEKASGFASKRELPVIWRIAKGALVNKIIILPVAFMLSYFLPALIPFILILGGLYLAFEGTEKIHEVIHHKVHSLKHAGSEIHSEQGKIAEIVLTEDEKVKSAILTDFILSIEIIVITLSTVIGQTLGLQIMVVSAIAIVATVGVYGVVALLVRMDDVGLSLMHEKEERSISYKLGNALVKGLPIIVKILGIVGTLAMLIVAGGIFSHNISFFHKIHENYLHSVPNMLYETLLGFIIGYICVAIFFLYRNIVKRLRFKRIFS